MPSITRKTQTDRDRRRIEIGDELRVATETLLGGGFSYTELSVERLCKEAEVSRSTFYAYFEDKGHLLRELTRDALTELGNIAREWWGAEQPIERKQLEAIIGRLLESYHRHGALLGAVADTAVYDSAVREVFGGLIEGFITEIAQMIERGSTTGAIDVTAPAREVSAFLVWMTAHTYYQEVRGADADARRRLAAAQVEVLWNTFYRA